MNTAFGTFFFDARRDARSVGHQHDRTRARTVDRVAVVSFSTRSAPMMCGQGRARRRECIAARNRNISGVQCAADATCTQRSAQSPRSTIYRAAQPIRAADLRLRPANDGNTSVIPVRRVRSLTAARSRVQRRRVSATTCAKARSTIRRCADARTHSASPRDVHAECRVRSLRVCSFPIRLRISRRASARRVTTNA